jgi:hypothetical protein
MAPLESQEWIGEIEMVDGIYWIGFGPKAIPTKATERTTIAIVAVWQAEAGGTVGRKLSKPTAPENNRRPTTR